tara:strand:+ start:3639 stop:4100 length:462 start_codon:yes stop_codon:yes gene_type:complete
MNKEKPRLIKSLIYEDFRGILLKPFAKETQEKYANAFLDSYTSISKENVFRGLHYQKQPFSQNKFFYIIKGEVIFYCLNVDNFDEYISFKIKVGDGTLYIPKGWASGFYCLEKENIVSYLSNDKYHKESEICLNYSIIPELRKKDFITSDKDK